MPDTDPGGPVPRRTCSCGMARAGDPGHDPEKAEGALSWIRRLAWDDSLGPALSLRARRAFMNRTIGAVQHDERITRAQAIALCHHRLLQAGASPRPGGGYNPLDYRGETDYFRDGEG